MEGYRSVRGPVPGALHRIVEMHDAYYGARWGFGPAFTRKNMTELSEFSECSTPSGTVSGLPG